MKKFNSLMMLMLVGFSSFTLTSCFEDAEEECNYDSELETYQSRLNSFSANPTSSTCSSLKNSAFALINKAEDCSDVDIADAAEAWSDIDCSWY
ncbi:MAG: hypothetical protein ACO1OQ_10635 [Rufibacter sp.]